MGSVRFVRRRVGLIGLLSVVLAFGPTFHVSGGGGFFQRRARSYGTSGAMGGSWGSHGATGGGRVVYTQAQPVRTYHAVPRSNGSHGMYASHGAVGGSPQSRVVASSTPARVYYPSNRVVVRRAPNNVPAAAAVVSSSSTLVQPNQVASSHVNTTPAVVVPPAPAPQTLKRFQHNENDTDLADASLYPVGALESMSMPSRSIAKSSLARHSVMKPATLEVDIPVLKEQDKQSEEVAIDVTDLTSQELPSDTPAEDIAIEDNVVQAVAIEEDIVADIVDVEDTVFEDTAVEAALVEVDEPVLDEAPSLQATEITTEKNESTAAIATTDTPSENQIEVDQLEADQAAAQQIEDQQLEAQVDVHVDSSVASDVDVQQTETSEETQPTADVTQADDLFEASSPEQENHEVEPIEPAKPQSILVRHNKLEKETTEEQPQQQEAKQETEKEEAPKATSHRARLVLHVPASADVFLMNQKMMTTGTTRHYNVPVNDPTKEHAYHIRVVSGNGVVVESNQPIRAGQQVEITFNGQAGTLALQQVSPFE